LTRAAPHASRVGAGRALARTYNVAVIATKRSDPGTNLLRAYLEAVVLSEEIQTRVWRAAELTLSQVRALRRLADEPKVLGQLGLELGLAPPSITRLADRLEERGLLQRSRAGEDRRKVVVTLTEMGKQLVSAVPPLLDGTAFRLAVDRMSPEDRERIAVAMRDFSAAVRSAEEEMAFAEAPR